MRAGVAFLCALALAAAGCGGDPRPITQMVIVIDSDLRVPNEIDRVTIEITGIAMRESASADLSERDFPRTLTLTHEGGPLGPITLEVVGSRGETAVVEARTRASFEADSTVTVEIELQRACVRVFCDASQSCEDGECRAIADSGSDDAGSADDGGGAVDDGGTDAGSDAAAGDAGESDAGDAGDAGGQDGGNPPANRPPACTITQPAAGETLLAGNDVTLEGSCTDPEDGALSSGLLWRSSRDGALGGGGSLVLASLRVGAHTLSLCAADPSDPDLDGCADISVTVARPPAPTASIDAVTQSGSSAQPFSSASPVDFTGSATGQQTTVSWGDSFVGEFATGTSAMLSTPVVGRHRVIMVVTDNVGQSAADATTFVVLAPGQAQLVKSFPLMNAALIAAGSGQLEALAADAAGQVLAADTQQRVYTFDPSAANPSPSVAIQNPPLRDDVRAIMLWPADDLAYFASKDGLTVCDYAVGTGVDTGACTTFRDGDIPDNDITSITRVVGSDDDEYLVLGTKGGVFATTATGGSATGDDVLGDEAITGVAAGDAVVWIATANDGLYRYDPVSGALQQRDGGPSSQLRAVAVDSTGAVWVASSNGIGRYDPAEQAWRTWRHGGAPEPGLASDDVLCLAIAQVMLDGETRDVIWIGTAAGVSRFDPTVPSFMTLTTADGLPSNTVRAIALLPDGSKVFGTSAGAALYAGP